MSHPLEQLRPKFFIDLGLLNGVRMTVVVSRFVVLLDVPKRVDRLWVGGDEDKNRVG